MSQITIWGRKSSVNVQSVFWCLEELDPTYCWIDDGLKHWVVTVSTFLEMNMNGEVPALIDADATATFEVGAILRYYATRPPVGTCWPKAPAATANVGKSAKQAKIDFINRQVMGRLGQPEEIASMGVYLASDESAFVTGGLHLIDGGWTL